VRFIQWKATVFYWLVARALGSTIWIGNKTLLERMLGGSLPENAQVSAVTWRNLSLFSAAFYGALGALNLWVAYTLSEPTWVTFKTWVVIPLVFVFTAGVVFWLLRATHDNPQGSA
jgi:intracellular septation protein